MTLSEVNFTINQRGKGKILLIAKGELESNIGAGRFGLPTSASRTLRANQTALRPVAHILYAEMAFEANGKITKHQTPRTKQ